MHRTKQRWFVAPLLIAATGRQPHEMIDTCHIHICDHYDEDANDEDGNDEEKSFEGEWEAETERAPVLQSGPQGVTAKGNKCKSRLTAARDHRLAEPGQANAGKARLTAARARSLAELGQARAGKAHSISLAARGCQDVISLTARGWPTGRGTLYRFVTAARVNGLAEPGQAHPFVSCTQSVRRYFPN